MVFAVIEGLVLCFGLLLVCVVSIRNGAVGGVHYYEKPVKERVVELGLITEKEIKRNELISGLVFILLLVVVSPLTVFYVNQAATFWDGFIQLVIMFMICGAFDRLFIDWFWVGHTKAWIIPGTEDLMPYIHKKTWIGKTVGTVVGYPLLAALLSWLFMLFR